MYIVLDKTIKGIRGVQLDNRKVLCAPGPTTKYVEPFFVAQKTIYICQTLNLRTSLKLQKFLL